MNVSEAFGNECVEAVRVFGYKCSRERREKKDACGATGNVENRFLKEVYGAASGISFESFGVPVLSELTDDSYKLSGG